MPAPFLPRRIYLLLFSLLGLVYVIGLFVPLMDSDSAHHASIALRMYLTGDYATLKDQSGDYLDKPHLLFWLSAFSYKVFGVSAFTYRLPSFLFTILCVYSVYRLGKPLYDKEVGKLSALLIASAFAFMLANNDVRMEAILTASIAFASWQLVEFIKNKKILNVAGAALGLALGFSTKGHIAVFVPAVTAFFYLLYRKDWKLLLNWKWLVMLILFGILISPVVYCYYLQYNLHPEKIVRGKDHINGVKFILFNQSVDRFSGEMGSVSKNDYTFFLHSFLWAFAPWSILAYLAVARRVRTFFQRKEEWATTGVFITVVLVISFSGFKLPHYLNIVFPAAAIMTADLLINIRSRPKWVTSVFVLQLILIGILLLLSIFINAWAFPVKQARILIGAALMLSVIFYFIKSPDYLRLQKAIILSVTTMVLVFFLLNSSFYPQLLKYQGGQALAETTKGKVDPADVYVTSKSFSASYVFYSRSLFKQFDDSLLQSGKKVWLLSEPAYLEAFRKEGYQTGIVYSVRHFRITKLTWKFLNPGKREQQCWTMNIAEVLSKK